MRELRSGAALLFSFSTSSNKLYSLEPAEFAPVRPCVATKDPRRGWGDLPGLKALVGAVFGGVWPLESRPKKVLDKGPPW